MQTQKSRIGNLAIALFMMILLWPHPAEAQQAKKVPRIGYLSGAASARSFRVDAFRQALRELGYVEGKNILVEYRYLRDSKTSFQDLVAELLQLKVDVLVFQPYRRSVRPNRRPKQFPLSW